MEACASFGFASGALEQAKFGVPACFVVLVSSSSGNNARIWMNMQRIFLHVPCSDAVKECHWLACLRKHVRCDGMTSSVSPQCLDRLRIQNSASVPRRHWKERSAPCNRQSCARCLGRLRSRRLSVSSPDGNVLTVGAKRLRFFQDL